MYPKIRFFIGGEWLAAAAQTRDVINPATGAPIGSVPFASVELLNDAISAAQKAFGTWRRVPAYDRARLMYKAASLVRERLERIATMLTLEQGKTLSEARLEVSFAADIIEWYAEEGKRTYGRIVPGRNPAVRQQVVREPVGPVAAFAPWNFPAVAPIRKIAGALAAGCSIIIKPAEETPGTCMELVTAFVDAGLPEGVLNLVFGRPDFVSEHLLRSEVIRKVSFTGSVPVGKLLMKQAADTMKRTTMELGGHAPVVVFPDADVEQAVTMVAAAKFRNAGQVCIAPSRFYVHEVVYEQFARRFAEIAASLVVGAGMEPKSQMGPLANVRRLDAMEKLTEDARKSGDVVTGGERIEANGGYFFRPTVVTGLPDHAKLMTTEPFGPIAPIVSFKTFDEVVQRVNALPYALASYAFTQSTKTALAISNEIEAGMVGINTMAVSTPETPFGGVKESGHGQEGGIEGLDAYTHSKFIAAA